MNQKEYKRTKKLWESAADFGKVILGITEGDAGVVFILKNGAAAAIVMGDHDEMDNAKLAETFKLFRVRLDDMIRHAENGTLQPDQMNQAYIRDTETGNYEPID